MPMCSVHLENEYKKQKWNTFYLFTYTYKYIWNNISSKIEWFLLNLHISLRLHRHDTEREWWDFHPSISLLTPNISETLSIGITLCFHKKSFHFANYTGIVCLWLFISSISPYIWYTFVSVRFTHILYWKHQWWNLELIRCQYNISGITWYI